jgi:hypothetical protein
MSVRQLKAPCWVADAFGGEDGAHFGDEDQARDVTGFPARELAEPCWVADCDDSHPRRECFGLFGNEDEGFDYFHAPTADALTLWLRRDDWAVDGDGNVSCPDARPGEAATGSAGRPS